MSRAVPPGLNDPEAEGLFYQIHVKDTTAWNAMVHGYLQFGKVDDALELFKQMPRKNVISWTTMICGYVPDYRSALHDVEDEQKEAMLWYHMRGLLLPSRWFIQWKEVQLQ